MSNPNNSGPFGRILDALERGEEVSVQALPEDPEADAAFSEHLAVKYMSPQQND